MADLGLTSADILKAMSDLGGTGYAALTSGTDFNRHVDCMNAGLRRFYYLSRSNGRIWSFLTPRTKITLSVSGSASGAGFSITYAAGTGLTTLTLATAATGIFTEHMAGGVITFATTSNEYPIAGYTSEKVITITGDADAETGTFAVTEYGVFDLPTDCQGVLGRLNFWGETTYYQPLIRVGENRIRELRTGIDTPARPQYFATRFKTAAASAGQAWELLVYPRPDAAYTLEYLKVLHPTALTGTGTEYVPGGAAHSETILESCLAVFEQRYMGGPGVHSQAFAEALSRSIALDDEQNMPDFLGSPDTGDADCWGEGKHDHGGYHVTYNGSVP